MVAQKFADNFWNQEFTSTAGFDLLVRRMKDGKSTYREIENFVKERAKIEEEYGKSLGRLARSSLGTSETGSMKAILTALKQDVERASALHVDMSKALIEQSARISKVRESYTNQWKQAEEVVKRQQASKRDLYNKTNSSQQNYQKKCAQYETAHQAYVSEKSANHKPQKEVEKLEVKAHKCKEERLKADDAYGNLVKHLEAVRQNWESEMEKMCEVFEQAELERILFFRNEIWVHINIDSKTMFDQDEMNEQVRTAMVDCDAQKDLEDFIAANATGSVRPAPVLYESGETKPTPKASRPPQRPALVPGASTFFSSKDDTEYDLADPTYASVS